MAILGEDERVDQDLLAVALDEALIAVLDQKGQSGVAASQPKLRSNLEQLLELDTFDVINGQMMHVIRMQRQLALYRHASVLAIRDNWALRLDI